MVFMVYCHFAKEDYLYDIIVNHQAYLQAHQKDHRQHQWWLTYQRRPLTHQMETSCKSSNWDNLAAELQQLKLCFSNCSIWHRMEAVFSVGWLKSFRVTLVFHMSASVGGEIQSLAWDPTGERLAVLLKGLSLLFTLFNIHYFYFKSYSFICLTCPLRWSTFSRPACDHSRF